MEKILSSCTKLAKQFGSAGLHPYKGCYEANVPTILDFNFNANIPFNSSFDAEYKKFTQKWLEEHPEEKEKMAKSKAEWQANFDSQFKIVAKIASDHNGHHYLVWHQ